LIVSKHNRPNPCPSKAGTLLKKLKHQVEKGLQVEGGKTPIIPKRQIYFILKKHGFILEEVLWDFNHNLSRHFGIGT